MEPHFAADSSWTPAIAGVSVAYPTIRIAYLLSYHSDGGSPNSNCIHSVPLVQKDNCAAHFGDSEFVVLFLRYRAQTQHWMMAGALMSAHYGSGGFLGPLFDSSQYYGPNQLQYPTKDLGYPRVWVARDKHANYASQSLCDAGAMYWDTCDDNSVSGRIRNLGSVYNVGSATVEFIDSTKSMHPFWMFDGTEYFWSSVPFCGWDTSSSSSNRSYCGGEYGEILSALGY